MRRTWISDADEIDCSLITGVTDITDIDQATVDDVIETVGWWKAETNANLPTQWTIIQLSDKTGGDNLFYISGWNDSSGNGNHLIQYTGNNDMDGLLAYGGGISGANGAASDKLNGYFVAHMTKEDQSTQSYATHTRLRGTVRTSDDFHWKSQGGTATEKRYISIVSVMRHHYDNSTYSIEYGNTGLDTALVHGGHLLYCEGTESWAVGISMQEDGNASGSQQTPNQEYYWSAGATGNSLSDDRLSRWDPVEAEAGSPFGDADDWHIACAWGENHPLGNDIDAGLCLGWNMSTYNVDDCMSNNPTPATSDAPYSNEITGSVGDDDGENFRVGGVNQDNAFEGRVAEMAVIRSDKPITKYTRAQIINYFKTKFGL